MGKGDHSGIKEKPYNENNLLVMPKRGAKGGK
jgi:hypothetical protein